MRRRHLYKEMNLRSRFELNLVSIVGVLQVVLGLKMHAAMVSHIRCYVRKVGLHLHMTIWSCCE
jgi:hypothetical protein